MTFLRHRPIPGLLMAAVLALTSLTLAAARGQVRNGDTVVLCSGGAAVTVSLGVEGKPTGPAHICPDMALVLLAGVAASPAAAPSPVVRPGERLAIVAASVSAPRGVPPARSRGPPVPA